MCAGFEKNDTLAFLLSSFTGMKTERVMAKYCAKTVK